MRPGIATELRRHAAYLEREIAEMFAISLKK